MAPSRRHWTSSVLPCRHPLRLGALLAVGALLVVATLAATESALPALAQDSSIHPTFPMLDADGQNVLESNGPVSPMVTCGGACHDTAYIAQTSFHADVGLGEYDTPGSYPEQRAWDTGPGFFGRWDPTIYRYLTPHGDALLDLGTADWVRLYGARHAGGGPAVTARDGNPLQDKAVTPADPETHVMAPASGEWRAWVWDQSGTAELNCFLCHVPAPNNEARMEALQGGAFAWASTATLAGTGIVADVGSQWQWLRSAFDESGDLKQPYAAMHDPNNENCGACHGLVHDVDEPILTSGCKADHWSTERTGQIVSPQRMSESGMNLADKDELSRSWDVHAERLVTCVDCHHSANNPIYRQTPDNNPLDHLAFDARKMDIADYLHRPSHELARGGDAELRCVSCHLPGEAHDWLPYKDRHFAALACESCHIPRMYAPARMQFDWTLPTPNGEAQIGCRGVEGSGGDVASLITGFEPVLLPRGDVDGTTSLAPHNLITSWFWVHGNPQRPVRQHDLEAALLDEDGYHDDIVLALDEDADGILIGSELALTTEEEVGFVAQRLEALGLVDPQIVGEIQPYAMNHGVTHGEWATSACQDCHSEVSRVTRPYTLASYVPGGVMPRLVSDSSTSLSGDITFADNGELVFSPVSELEGVYVIGHDRRSWVDWLGALSALAVTAAVVGHAGLRTYHSLHRSRHEPELRRVYMYSAYERTWHWLQALAIGLLVLTGFAIHTPDLFGLFPYQTVVRVHNVLGFVLLANAALAVFYHVAGGGIRRFLPEPKGFFSQAVQQVAYYVRGIMRGDKHPFEKQRAKRLNPLQQVTYLVILNVLLPLQIVTGVMIWGAQVWPNLAERAGGLWLLAPVHTLVSWLFVSFLILHIYLTTTGHTPTASIEAMVVGWEDVVVDNANHQDSVHGHDQPTLATTSTGGRPARSVQRPVADTDDGSASDPAGDPNGGA